MKKLRIPLPTVICTILLFFTAESVWLANIFFALMIHEAGHLLVMALFGIKIECITLLPVGIDIKRRERAIAYPAELLLALAGPLANISIYFAAARTDFGYTNLLYGLLNLLPVRGLDGGYGLEAALLCFFEPVRAYKLTIFFSCFFLTALWLAGCYIMLMLNGNITVFMLSVFLFISTIIKK